LILETKPKIEVDAQFMTSIQDLFKIGMSREIPELLDNDNPRAKQINVGAGTYKILYGAEPIDFPKWDARNMEMPYENESVDVIHCYHFLEHMDGETAVKVLKEFERILEVGGHANIVVPYYNSHLQAKCLDHKSMWNESTWDNLFNQYSYDNGSGEWKLKVHTTFIMGVEEKNLALLTQLVKTK
jgi:ubiquinone/menaquinone biosynthesis C-methylase UbiE